MNITFESFKHPVLHRSIGCAWTINGYRLAFVQVTQVLASKQCNRAEARALIIDSNILFKHGLDDVDLLLDKTGNFYQDEDIKGLARKASKINHESNILILSYLKSNQNMTGIFT